MQSDIQDEIVRAVPGAIGALVALRWMGGTPWQVSASLLGGASGAYYGTPHAMVLMGTQPGLTGFLIGLFGMAIASRVFEALSKFDLGALLERVLGKRSP